jgi:hypothetical protein
VDLLIPSVVPQVLVVIKQLNVSPHSGNLMNSERDLGMQATRLTKYFKPTLSLRIPEEAPLDLMITVQIIIEDHLVMVTVEISKKPWALQPLKP